ncbi:MAG: hypothetical protein EPN97_06000 [Alphaproteobacteria bacterium]|nr:MAG: hypothetical protein EPN97_06000 [Alphaproteobacteria bacterium]
MNKEIVELAMRRAIQLLNPPGCAKHVQYCFTANEVAGLYLQKSGVGKGIWFCLKDGRVYDAYGRLSENDPTKYNA